MVSMHRVFPAIVLVGGITVVLGIFMLGSYKTARHFKSLDHTHHYNIDPRDPGLTIQQRDGGVKRIIAICVPTRSLPGWKSLADTALQTLLIPSVERTVSAQERNACIDRDDVFWLEHHEEIIKPHWLSLHVEFYKVPKHRVPFNKMTHHAFSDGAEYLVCVNDATEFITKGWISKGVESLLGYDPPNLGVVGPTCNEGNTRILTNDMVHRTHLKVFEDYYPPVFSAWWIDDWMTKVYEPGRSKKLKDWVVRHHIGKHGTRYKVQHNESKVLNAEVEKGKTLISEWGRLPMSNILSNDAGNDWIAQRLQKGTPFVVGRLGAAEACLVQQYLNNVDPIKACQNRRSSSGIYPETAEVFKRFSMTYWNTLRRLGPDDAMASLPIYKSYEEKQFPKLQVRTVMQNRALEPFYFGNPWSQHLRSKTVLVVHGFVSSIKCQLSRRVSFFNNTNTVPDDIRWKFVQMTQCLGKKTPHASWFETLQHV